MKTIRTLVVDDSGFMRKSLTQILETDESIKVVDSAANGQEALEKTGIIHPDVILLDIEMPVMDGLAALSHIMAEVPTPVVMISGIGKADATIAIKSLEHGAVDFIAKPSGVISYDIGGIRNEIVHKVKVAAAVDVRKIEFKHPEVSYETGRAPPTTRKEIVVIGASTGGPRALSAVLPGLSRDLPAAVIVVQHLGKSFMSSLAKRLQWECPLNVRLARRGDAVRPGSILLAPGGIHIEVARDDGGRAAVKLSKRRASGGIYPSVDFAMSSAARIYGDAALGVILTGAGRDGALGMKAIKDAGGSTIAEHESTCIVYGMPRAAIALGVIDEVVPLPQIAARIAAMV